MNRKKVLFFDIDGTLMDSYEHKVPKSTIEALKRLKDNGHKVVISTGRGMFSIVQCGFSDIIKWDGYICNNGQMIYNENKEVIYSKYIDKESAEKCMELCHKRNSPYVYSIDGTPYLWEFPDDNMNAAYTFFQDDIPQKRKYNGENIVMFIIFGDENYDYSEYQKIDGIDVIPGRCRYADIVAKGFDKGNGIKYIKKYFDADETYSFGDSLNDIGMFKESSVGIAMGNANDEAKEAADYITDSVMDDGIFNACVHFKLI